MESRRPSSIFKESNNTFDNPSSTKTHAIVPWLVDTSAAPLAPHTCRALTGVNCVVPVSAVGSVPRLPKDLWADIALSADRTGLIL